MRFSNYFALPFLILSLSSTVALAQEPQGVRLTAVDSLEGLSSELRFNRVLGGSLTTAAGVGIMLIGSSISSDYDDDDYYTDDYNDGYNPGGAVVFSGAIVTGIGVAQLLIPTPAERAWKRVGRLDDEDRRESRAFNELNILANQARTSRLLSGGLSLGLGAYFFLASPEEEASDNYYLYNGIIFSAIGVSNLLVKSPEERAFNQLQDQSTQAAFSTPELGLAFVPNHGLGMGFSVSF